VLPSEGAGRGASVSVRLGKQVEVRIADGPLFGSRVTGDFKVVKHTDGEAILSGLRGDQRLTGYSYLRLVLRHKGVLPPAIALGSMLRVISQHVVVYGVTDAGTEEAIGIGPVRRIGSTAPPPHDVP
jgi:hypothetical protein